MIDDAEFTASDGKNRVRRQTTTGSGTGGGWVAVTTQLNDTVMNTDTSSDT